MSFERFIPLSILIEAYLCTRLDFLFFCFFFVATHIEFGNSFGFFIHNEHKLPKKIDTSGLATSHGRRESSQRKFDY